MTRSSLRKMEDDLNRLKGEEMVEKLRNLADARDKGDISENAEYDIAKEEFENHQIRINNLTNMLKNVILIDESNIDISKVGVLTKVKVLNKNINKEQEFSIVPENEIDVKSGKISSNTPIVKGLMNKCVGDVVEINVPVGILELEILNISFYK